MKTLTTRHVPALVMGAALALAGGVATASGTHGGGHGHGKKDGDPARAMQHGHDQARIDYSSVEEHEFGKASDPEHAATTVTVDMTDEFRFEPAEVRVKAGETVRFVVRNRGKLMHEMVLGTGESLHQHAAMMQKFPGMEHDEPHMAHVDPGKQHVMGWQFTKPGEYSFGCLVPGHFEAGMKGTIIVE